VTQLANVLSDLVFTPGIAAHKLELRVLENSLDRFATNMAGCPLNHSIGHISSEP
jgi:hypothetical protein